MLHLTRSILAMATVLFFCMPADTSGQSKPVLVKNNWISIVLTNDMTRHLVSLENTERLEQYRDWIKLSAVEAIGFNKTTNFELCYDFNPLRNDYTRNISNYNFGEGRSIPGPKDSLYIIVPAVSTKKVRTIAQQADNFRLTTGRKPKAVLLLEYKLDTINRTASFAYTTDIAPDALYSEKYGYIETIVNTRTDLTALLNRTDDIVYAALQGDIIYLGGRKYPGYQGKKIDLEDIAVIYQAGNRIYENEIARVISRGLLSEYDDRINDLIAYNVKKDPRFLLTYSMAELQEEARIKFPYSGFVADYLASTKKRADELNVGFSLDPAVKYHEMYEALNKIVRGDTASLRALFRNEMVKGLVEQYTEKNNKKPEEITAYRSKETSIRTLMGIDSAGDSDEPENREQNLAVYLEGRYRVIQRAVQKNKGLLGLIAQQLNAEKEGKELLLFHYFNSYVRGDYTLDIRGAVDDKWSFEKKTIYNKAISDLTEALYDLGYLKTRTVTGYTPQVIEALKMLNYDYRLGIQDFTSLSEKRLNYIISLDSVKWDETDGLFLFLNNIIKPYKYQKARYDGDFQGTRVGMTLFYTDLVMKIWSFNYKNTFPYIIPGFYPQTNYRISALYQQEIKKNPYTRSWLGPLLSGMEIYNGGKQVYFSHTVTRIYNASSNDLIPGIEVPAHMSSDRFSNWWNLHYEDVADHETEYQRLNQIMKWSFLVSWLKTNNKMQWLNQETGLTRNLEFSSWYQSNNTLKVHVDLPFLDKGKLKEKTECIDILVSRPFQWFKENRLEYIFSGGISLVNKRSMLQKIEAVKNPLVSNRLLNRSGLVTVQNDASNFSILETKYKVNAPQSNAVITAGKMAGFKGRETEFFNLGISRSVKTSPGKLEVSQAATGSNTISLGGVRVEKVSNTIKLSGLQNDVNTYKEFFMNDDLLAYIKINEQKIYLDDKTFILKIDKTNCWAIGKVTGEKDIIQTANASVNPRFTYTDGYAKYDVQLVSEGEITAEYLKNGWFKIGKGTYSDVQFVQHTPQKVTTRLVYTDGVHKNEALVETTGIFIRQNNVATDKAVAQTLASSGGQAVLDAINYDKAKAFIVKGDELIRLGRDLSAGSSELQVLRSMLPAEGSALKAILVNPEVSSIRFVKPGILEVPEISRWKTGQKEAIAFVLQRTEYPGWARAFENAGSILTEDIKEISKFYPDNASQASSYFRMKSLTYLDENTAFVDLQSSSKQPQVVIKTGSGAPQVKTIDAGQSASDMVADIQRLYETDETFSNSDILRSTRAYADMLYQVCNATSAKNIITMEPSGINGELIKRYHNIHPEKIIYKDQPELAASVRNANKKITVDFEKSVIMITATPAKNTSAKTKVLIDSLRYFGMKQAVNLTSKEFLQTLRDSTVTQMNIIVRGDQYGLVFSDASLSYRRLKTELLYMSPTHKKDLIYIVSNVADTLESLFAAYPIFSRVITSTFTLKDKDSFDDACMNMKAIYSGAYNEQLIIPPADWKAIQDAEPSLKYTLGNSVKQSRKQVTVNVGKLNADQLKSIPKSLWNYVSEKIEGSGKTYTPKNFDNLIHGVQAEKLLELKTRPVTPVHFLRSIPVLKVMNKPVTLSTAC